MSNLLDKLRQMDADTRMRPDGSTSEPSLSPHAAAPQAQTPFHHIRTSFPLTLFCDLRPALHSPLLSQVFNGNFPARLQAEDFLFLDTETTGLSGGVGTLAFQVGLGYMENQHFVVEQFFMRDYHEEPLMLRELAARLSRFAVLVSFNGRTFDVPLLQSRFQMNRLDLACLSLPHADLLYPARRLWKLRLQSCRLSHLEETLLGITRTDDLPGAQVPQVYFRYLKDRVFEPIQRVLSHNRQDIVSLAQLFFYLCHQYARPEGISHGEDLLSLARFFDQKGQDAQATKCYRLSARGTTRAQAFQGLAAQQKRQGQTDHAIRLYTAMLRRGEDPAFACEALAKLYEHQKRDVQNALHYTRQALLLLSQPRLFPVASVQERKIALQYRYARLQRKLG